MKKNRPFCPYGAYSKWGFVPPTVLIVMFRSGSASNALSTPSVNPMVRRKRYAAIADSASLWRGMLDIARNNDASEASRKASLFWVS